MKIIIAVDNANGTMFARRRQSLDIKLREYILELTNGQTLCVSNYTAKQFANHKCTNMVVDDNLLDKACEQDFCFVEGQSLREYQNSISTIYICKWNRSYPNDKKLDIDYKNNRKLVSTVNIVGNSHKKITIEEWSLR